MPIGVSRYSGVAKLTCTGSDGVPVQYYARPAIPQIAAANVAQQVMIRGGERPDLLAYRAYGDPLSFWWIANANPWLDPFSITAIPGVVVAIPAPGA